MGLERRDAGRWRRDGASRGNKHRRQCRKRLNKPEKRRSRGDSSPLGLGGSGGLDGTDADGSRTGSEGRQVVQAD